MSFKILTRLQLITFLTQIWVCPYLTETWVEITQHFFFRVWALLLYVRMFGW